MFCPDYSLNFGAGDVEPPLESDGGDFPGSSAIGHPMAILSQLPRRLFY